MGGEPVLTVRNTFGGMRAILIIALLLRFNASAQTLQQQLQGVASNNGLIGMSVVTTCGTLVTNTVHTGKSDVANNIDVGDSTRYRIASISKLVTAVGLMQLHEQSLFGLDDDVSMALGFTFRNPSFPNTPITYRMVLSHTSSFQDGTGYSDFLSATYSTAPPPPISELATPTGNWYTADMWRTEQPGTYYTYSNANFGIVGTLIEAHSSQRFDAYMRQQVLLPLGIGGSYNVQDLNNLDALAVLYRNSNPQADNFNGVMPPPPDLSQYVIGTNGLFFAPQGGLRVSALELARIAMMLENEGTLDGITILQPATVALMRNNEWTWNGSNGDNYYGLFRSWGLGTHRITAQAGGDVVFPGVPMFGHAGEAYGLISDLYSEPVHGFGLVFITNGYTSGNAYQFGTSSAFYTAEEDVYAALLQYAYPVCIAMGAPEEHTTGNPLQVVGDRLVWSGDQAATITAFGALGNELERFTMQPGSIRDLSVMGVVYFRHCDDDGCETVPAITTR